MNSQHIIARYSAWKALPATIGPILGLLLIYIVPLIYKEGPLTILRSGRSYAPFVVIGWFVAPFYIFMLLRIVVRILFRNRMAVWQDGDKIHYMDSRLSPTAAFLISSRRA